MEKEAIDTLKTNMDGRPTVGGRQSSKWTHLWNAANALSTASPTISRHLGFKLANEACNEMSSFTKGLICEQCGSLINPVWSSTRIRKRRRALRRRRNKVIVTCTVCNNMKHGNGSVVVQKEGRNNDIRRKLRHDGKKKISKNTRYHENENGDKDVDSTEGGDEGKKSGRMLKQLKHKCKKRKEDKGHIKEQGVKANLERSQGRSNGETTGLASSFLFDKIED